MNCPKCHSHDTVGTGGVVVRHIVVAGVVTHEIDDARLCNACGASWNVPRKPGEAPAKK